MCVSLSSSRKLKSQQRIVATDEAMEPEEQNTAAGQTDVVDSAVGDGATDAGENELKPNFVQKRMLKNQGSQQCRPS